ncbi:MAG: HAD-IA family hydrolase [Eubacteriales bacterium]|nr:HAD-IA family hydrolase [Eubacteriales bacterium]
MKKYKAVIFDMDGTILDTLEDLKDALNYSLRETGYPEHTLAEVRTYVGNGIRRLIECAVPEGTEASECDRIQGIFMPYYERHCADKTCAYPGIPELLRRLKREGFQTAVVSNKADGAVQELVVQYFDGLFDVAVGEREGVRRKPAPDMVRAALCALGRTEAEAVYVGDSEVDMATAANAGLDRIIVDWGFRDREFLAARGAERIVSKAEEIYEAVR